MSNNNAANRKYSSKSRAFSTGINGLNTAITNMGLKNNVNNAKVNNLRKEVANMRGAINTTTANFIQNYNSLAKTGNISRAAPKVTISQMNIELNKLKNEIALKKSATNKRRLNDQKQKLTNLKGELVDLRKRVGASNKSNQN